MPGRGELYDNGNRRLKGKSVGGKMQGHWEFYRKDGSLMRSGSFDQDRQVGIWKTFDRDGRLVKETDFGA
jgi:antitoxin component YwqK of YwqJK toxin-antitoxin module